MDDPFESPRLLIEDARLDVATLDSEFKAWVKKLQPESVVSRDPQTGEHLAKLRYAEKMPGRFRVLASNAVNNLRHALDQAVNCAAVQLGGRDTNYFPFAQSASDMDAAMKDRCKKVPVGLHPVLKGFKPYPGGDDLLCAVQIANKNKHRGILNLHAEAVGGRHEVNARMSGPGRVGTLIWDSHKQELEMARVAPGTRLDMDSKGSVVFRIELRNTPTPQGEPATAILYSLADKVESVLLALEAETARLRGV